MYGKFHSPGYIGLFWGSIYDKNGKKIQRASDYFYKLAGDEFDCWDAISSKIDEYCAEYLDPLLPDDLTFTYQCGFGGDECDGLIDFYLPVQVPELPDLKLNIEDEEYTLKWKYSEPE